MNNLYLNRLPIVTGAPRLTPQAGAGQQPQQQGSSTSFQELLRERMQGGSQAAQSLTFSKHASQRVLERGIDLSQNALERLNRGAQMAAEKGLNDTLILVDRTAFLVNVKNNRVITTINHEELQGNVFTNIDGTVII